MSKIIVFTILLLSAMAVTVGTTITTTIQIQPAYSQATHCGSTPLSSACITPGQDASISICLLGSCRPPVDVAPQIAGQSIGSVHKACGQERAECTVIPP